MWFSGAPPEARKTSKSLINPMLIFRAILLIPVFIPIFDSLNKRVKIQDKDYTVMVQVIFKGHDHMKADQIIEAAQMRFARYGFEKTTMKEIAGDLNMSKGSLYYYFPDKENLYKAIVGKEHDLFIHEIRAEIEHSEGPVAILRKIVHVRQEVFKKLINLGRTRLELFPEMHLFMKETITDLRKQEKEIILEILEKGMADGIFDIANVEETADLLLDLLRGLRMTMLKEITSFQDLNKEYKQMTKKTSLLVDIFIKGISRR
jgi:TetR/AcrR family transcriptional regulator